MGTRFCAIGVVLCIELFPARGYWGAMCQTNGAGSDMPRGGELFKFFASQREADSRANAKPTAGTPP